MKAAGCRRGAKCPFHHDLSSLTRQQRARISLWFGRASPEGLSNEVVFTYEGEIGSQRRQASGEKVGASGSYRGGGREAGTGGAPSIGQHGSQWKAGRHLGADVANGGPGLASSGCIGHSAYISEGVEGDWLEVKVRWLCWIRGLLTGYSRFEDG